jgi:beta-glucosidase
MKHKYFKTLLPIILLSFIITGYRVNKDDIPAYKNKNLPIKERVSDLIKRMTLEEKVDMLGGTGFATTPIARLNIPELKMTDGPLGVRWGNSTAFPSGIAMASTWNPELIQKLGTAIGEEVIGKNRNVILGPCVNIARIPQGGRNFESFGEDPFLTSRIAVGYINGVQKMNVAATVKHFACNNQEYERDFVNVKIDERALNEIYLPSFKAAVKEANVLAVMSSYNKVNDHYASENDYLLVDKLKKEWGFNGLVMSDWGAVHSTFPTYKGGLDLEMPTGDYLNKNTLLNEIKTGKLNESVIDEKISRVLGVMFKLGLFDNVQKEDSTLVNNPNHKKIAYEVEKEGIVLLKNSKNILPISNKIKNIAVIGPNGNIARTGGGGSSMVSPFKSVSILEGLQNRTGTKANIKFVSGVSLEGDAKPISGDMFFQPGKNEHGLKAEYFNNKTMSGNPVLERIDKQISFSWGGNSPDREINDDNFSARWNSDLLVPASGNYLFDLASDDGSRLYIDGNLVIDNWGDHAVESKLYEVKLEKGKRYNIKTEYFENGGDASVQLGWRLPDENPLKDAIELAKNSDLVFLCVGTSAQYESEGKDRKDLILPNNQDSLIKAISGVNNNVIVVLSTGSPVIMNKWINDVDGIIETWFGGEEIGNAVADVILGNYNPSGKLPITFPVKWEDCSAYSTYRAKDSVSEYSDGIYVGYRHYEKEKIKPLFPFGFGLSYTTFKYSNIRLSSPEIATDKTIEITCDITNTGHRVGSEIAQLYIKDIVSSVDRPEKELKGFAKVYIEPGKTKKVTFKIDLSSLSFFDPGSRNWKAEPGEFSAVIGSSSDDKQLEKTFTLK